MAKLIDINRPLQDLGDRLIAAIKAKLIKQNHNATGRLHKSLSSQLENIPNGKALDIYAESYATFVERRRKPGFAPFRPILKWVLATRVFQKIEKFRNNPKSFAFAVIRNKAKYGTPTPNRPNFGFNFISETVEKDQAGVIEQAIDKAFFFEPTQRIDNLMKATL